MHNIERWKTENLFQVFTWLTGVFGTILTFVGGVLTWLIKKSISLENKIAVMQDNVGDNKEKIDNLVRQNELLTQLVGDMKAVRTDIEWLKQTLTK